MKNVIKTIVFIILLLISIHTFGYFLRPSFTLDNSWPAFIKEKKNTIDVLFIGDSGIYSDVSPMAIYRDTGITSYDLASPAATNMAAYYAMLEAVKYQHPKVIVMNVTKMFDGKETNAFTHQVADILPLNSNKINMINDSNYSFSDSDKLGFIEPFFKYHDNWRKINFLNKTNKGVYYLKGYIFNSIKKSATNGNNYMEDDGTVQNLTPSYVADYILKTKEYCDENDIKLLLISVPDTVEWNYDKYVAASAWAKTNNLTYLDFNDYLGELGINYTNDTYDAGNHLNISGATKLSNYLGEYLQKNYDGLVDHRSDPAYSSWNNDLQKYIATTESSYEALQNS